MRPQELAANQPPDRFYLGGARIAGFRGLPDDRTRVPEDWVGSTTELFGGGADGAPGPGLSRLADGGLLRDAVRRDPAAWLGPRHAAARGADPALLVKLLDAGQRLPVHVHPDVPFATEHLASGHGKTEAWVFLTPATVHLAFTEDVPAARLSAWVRDQRTDEVLASMHAVDVEAGDAVLVPAGMPHAIGEGAFVVELQEPTDLSILLEWKDFEIDGAIHGHLGLGFDLALQAVDRRGWTRDEVLALRGARGDRTGDLLPAAAEFFRVERTRGAASSGAGFAVLVVVAGTGELTGGGARVAVRPGSTVVVPHAAGDVRLTGGADLEVLWCRPPRGET